MPFTTAATGTRDAPAARQLPRCWEHAYRSQRRRTVAGIYILERAPRLIKSRAPCKSLANHGGTGSGTLLAAQRLEPWHGGTMNNKKLGLIAFAACLAIAVLCLSPPVPAQPAPGTGSIDAGANLVNPPPNQDDDTTADTGDPSGDATPVPEPQTPAQSP